MVDYKVELKEKLKFKEGVGISTYDRGGRKKRTYQYGDVSPPKDTSQKEKRTERIAEQDRIKKAYDKRLAKEEEKRRAVKDEEYDLGKTTTGRYEKGGAIIQETKGDFNTLQFLAAQQPGSRLVQNKAGEYVLIRSSGINFGSDANLLKLNENLELEGRTEQYTPTSKRNVGGGIDYFRQIKDTVSGGEGKKPSEGKAEPFEKPKGVVSAKYNVEVGSNIVTAQYTLKKGNDYAITLNEGRQGYQKQRALSPREIAAGMSAGEIPLGFIGSKGAAGVLVDTEQKGQTYVDSAGNPIVTIMGQSKGSEFGVFQTVKPTKTIPQSEASVLNFLEAKQPERKQSNIELAGQTALNIGIDIISGAPFLETGVPKYTKPVKEKIGEYRKETQVDLLMNPDRWKEIKPLSREFLIPASVYGLTAFVGGKPNIKLKGKAKTPVKPETKPVPPFKQTVMKDMFADDTALFGWKQELVPLGRKYIPDPKIISTGPKQPANIKPDIDYMVPRRPVSKFPGDLPEGITTFQTSKIKMGKSESIDVMTPKGMAPVETLPIKIQAKSKIKQSVKLDPNYRPSRAPISRDPSVFADDTALAGIKTTRIEMGKSESIDVMTPKGMAPVETLPPPGRTAPSLARETKIGLGKSSATKKLRGFFNEPIALGRSYPRSETQKLPIDIRAKIGKTFLTPKEPLARETKIGLGEGLIKNLKGEFISEKIGLGWGVLKSPYKSPFKSEVPTKPIELDSNYRVPKWGSKLYAEDSGSIFSKNKMELGRGIIRYSDAGIQKSAKAAKDFDKKIRKSKPAPDAEERVSKGLIAIMKEPPFKSTKIELGRSDQTLQIRDGKVIQDSIKKPGKTSSSPQPFSVPPSTTSGIYSSPIGYPPGTKNIFTPILVPTQQETQITPQQSTRQVGEINLLKQITNPLINTDIKIRQGIRTTPTFTQRDLMIQEPKLRETQKLTPKQRQQLKPQFKWPEPKPQKQPQQLNPLFRQRTLQKQVLEEIPPPKPPKIIPVWVPPPRVRTTKKEEPSPRISKKSWRGNVPEFDIAGIYKKEIEVTYLKKRRGKKKPSFDRMVKKIF